MAEVVTRAAATTRARRSAFTPVIDRKARALEARRLLCLLMPKLRGEDPHDVHLAIVTLLTPVKQRKIFMRKRPGGGFVF